MAQKRILFQITEALELACLLHTTGEPVAAEKLFRRILRTDQDNLDAMHFLAVLCNQQQRYDEAARLIGRIIAIDPVNADAHNNLGNVLQAQGRVTEAESCYRLAIRHKPDHAAAHNNLGVMLSGRKRFAESLKAHQRAVESAPDSEEFHYCLGNAYLRAGKANEAVRAYETALSLDPGSARTWQQLARTYLLADRPDLAANVYEDWLRLNPGDPSITYRLNACRGTAVPNKAPEAYVQQLFDTVANQFDTHLESLDYRAPELIYAALAAALPTPAANLDILDAGCGTGLCAPLLRFHARQLTGVDLSTGMLNRAEARNLYDRLVMAELTDFIARHPTSYDVIVSSDTLCYFGELGPLFTVVSAALKPEGLFAFTLESAADSASTVVLLPAGRYQHAKEYVDGTVCAAGLTVQSYGNACLRKESGNAVEGHLYVVKKPGGGQ